MKKLLAVLLISSPCYAGLITHTDYTSGNTITASGQNANENAIVNEFNGNIDNTNIKSGAAIAVNKLAAMGANKLTLTDSSGFVSTSDQNITTNSSMTITGLLTASSMTFSPAGYGIVGTTTGGNANVGIVGEYISSASVSTNLLNASNTTFKDMLAVQLTAGEWDLTAVVSWDYNTGTANFFMVGISTTSGNSSAGLSAGNNFVGHGVSATANFDDGAYGAGHGAITQVVPNVRFSLTTTTTIYLKTRADFSVNTPASFGRLSARRIR